VFADLGKGRSSGDKDMPQEGFDAEDVFLEGPFSGGWTLEGPDNADWMIFSSGDGECGRVSCVYIALLVGVPPSNLLVI